MQFFTMKKEDLQSIRFGLGFGMKITAQKQTEAARFLQNCKNRCRLESSNRHYAFSKKSGKQFRRSWKSSPKTGRPLPIS
jgi:hypothetical protein